MKLPSSLLAAMFAMAPLSMHAADLDLRGNVGFEYFDFPRYAGRAPDPASNPGQVGKSLALRGQLEASYAASDNVSFAAQAFLRRDMDNDDRDASRLDELWVQYAASDWDLRVGNQLVTWGSVESVSPLDVINPRDYEEDLVEPRKIGLFATRLRRRFDAGDWSVFWLPRYEPSLFASPASYYSFSGGLPVQYPDSEWARSQWATRYFHSGGGFDVGVSYFSGLERNATFEDSPSVGGVGGLAGRTYPTKRLGLDVTAIAGEVLLKGEFVYRTTHETGNRRALLYVVGAEYTRMSVWGHSDLTFFAEYLGSSNNVRKIELMQNDLFLAARWTFNDPHRQRLQAGAFIDLDRPARYVVRAEYQVRPFGNLELMLRYTATRNYYPGPAHTESNNRVLHLLLKYNF